MVTSYKVGEIKNGRELGKSVTYRFIWVKCPKCGEERWQQYSYFLMQEYSQRGLCPSCAQKIAQRHRFLGSRREEKDGYISVGVPQEDFFRPMANKAGRMKEHRLIMAKHLGRCLLPWEVVHHRNGKKGDNRLENLELLPDRRWHLIDWATKGYIKRLQKRISELEDIIKTKKVSNTDTH